MKPISRRALLRGFLGGALVTVGLPPLELFLNGQGTALASGEGFPARFGLFFWGNGVLPDRWTPRGEGAQWELSDELAPLAGVKEHITVISGLSVKQPNIVPHHSGSAGLLTGSALIGTDEDHTFPAATIDQLIAAATAAQTRFASLEFGAAPGEGVSYKGPNQRNPPESSPYALFERLFGVGFRAPGEEAVVDPRLGLRRSVLDAVLEDNRALQRRLGAQDRRRMDQHMEGIRTLERQIARLEEDPPDLASCRRPAAPLADYPEQEGRPQLKAINRAMCDTVALALACDQTRVFSNFFTQPLTNLLFQGASAGHHQLTHNEPGDQPTVHQIVLQIMEEYAYMIASLRAIPEGDGTLLDHCALLGASEIAWGRNHSLEGMPLVLAGGACGALRQGIHLKAPGGESTSKLMLTLLRACGVRAASFGTGEGAATEGLSGVEA